MFTDDEYISRNLVHPLHTTERKSFRGCRRRWNWIFREFYYPLSTPKQLEFGVAYHAAMEVWYDPTYWSHPDHHEIYSKLAVAKFNQVTKQQLQEYTRLNGQPDPEKMDEYNDKVALGRKMLDYFTTKVSPFLDKDLTPIGVEVPFEVSLGFKCTCNICWNRFSKYLKKHDPEFLTGFAERFRDKWNGLPVTYGGRIDAIFEDKFGRVYVADWKTCTSILEEGRQESFLELEDQITSYLLALWKLGRPVWGFIYHEQRKAVPESPTELTRMVKGRRFSTAKNAPTDYETFLNHISKYDPDALAAGTYDEYLRWLRLDGPRFFQRHQIHRNLTQLENAWDDMVAEAHDIIENPRIYPQPGRFACTNCAYQQPCIGMNAGEDYRYALDTLFEKRTKHYFETMLSTE